MKMKITVGRKHLLEIITTQLNNNFLLTASERKLLVQSLPAALDACQSCFAEITNKYYSDEKGLAVFSPYHSGQYCIFLYTLSHLLCQRCGASALTDKIYYLNKMLNGCDLFHEVSLPAVWFIEHPVGSVLGRATYGNYLVFQQGCTVGANKDTYPTLGEYVWLFANASIIGACCIGSNVFVAAGAQVVDADIPDNTIVFGRSPHLTLKSKPAEYFWQRSPFRVHHR